MVVCVSQKKSQGFSLVELLYALFIMCVFCTAAVSAMAPFISLGKFKNSSANFEQSILKQEVIRTFSNKFFLRRVDDFSSGSRVRYNFPICKLVEFLGLPVVSLFIIPKNKQELYLEWTEKLLNVGEKGNNFSNYVMIDSNFSSIKLRPVYTVKHMPSKYGSETWKNSKLVDFTTKNFETLCDQYRSGEISRIYLVFEKS